MEGGGGIQKKKEGSSALGDDRTRERKEAEKGGTSRVYMTDNETNEPNPI